MYITQYLISAMVRLNLFPKFFFLWISDWLFCFLYRDTSKCYAFQTSVAFIFSNIFFNYINLLFLSDFSHKFFYSYLLVLLKQGLLLLLLPILLQHSNNNKLKKNLKTKKQTRKDKKKETRRRKTRRKIKNSNNDNNKNKNKNKKRRWRSIKRKGKQQQ